MQVLLLGKLIKILKVKFFYFFILFFTLLAIFTVFHIKNKIITTNNNLIIIKKGLNEHQLIRKLNKLNISISYIEWVIVKFFFNYNISIKYGEYFLPKNITIFELQKKLNLGKTFVRKFTLIEGSDSEKLKIKLDNTFGLTGKIKSLKEGIYKPDTYNYQWGDTKSSLLKRMENDQIKLLSKFWNIRSNKNGVLTGQKFSWSNATQKLVDSVYE